MFTSGPTIATGDVVLVFISRGNIKPVVVTPDEVITSRYGSFAHNDMIGAKWGTQMPGANGRGFVHLLKPTPELWTLSLPHRTQIVYTHDSSYIMQRMEVTAGSRVLEAGTGSGSFTHAFSRTVTDEGRLFTYEFHEPRYLEAKCEFERHGLANTTITHRDVCNNGFQIYGVELNADAVFLDLPLPWEALAHLEPAMAKNKQLHVCCFSPCIEQVDRTVKALEQYGWTKIEMVKVNCRRWEARQEMVKDLDDIVKRLKNIHQRKEQGINLLRAEKEQRDHPEVKRPKVEKIEEYNPFGKGKRIREGQEGYKWEQVTRVELEIKTHTSYLTFAIKVPIGRQQASESEKVAPEVTEQTELVAE